MSIFVGLILPATAHARAQVGGHDLELAGGGLASMPQAQALQDAFQRVVLDAAPSVVGVRTRRVQLAHASGLEPGQVLTQHVGVNGSGVVIASAGLILTNEHVVQAASDIEVVLHDGRRLRATVVCSDPRSDLAILRVPCSDLVPVRIGASDEVARGQWAIVLGNPFGLGADGQLSVSVGVISNVGRQLPGLGEVDDRFYSDMLQVTAPISPGNSGGPLLNLCGELIGIVTAMHTRAPADEGVGFAIALTPAKQRIIDALCRGERIAYGYLGVRVRSPDVAECESLGLTHGVVVELIEPAGPADTAGLVVGDVIVHFDGHSVTGPGRLADLVGQTPVGARVKLAILRAGREQTIGATIGRRDVSQVSWMRGEAVLWRGLRLADLSAAARRVMNVDPGVTGVLVIDVLPNSPARQTRIEIGDVIERVDGVEVSEILEMLPLIRDATGPIRLSIRGKGEQVITE